MKQRSGLMSKRVYQRHMLKFAKTEYLGVLREKGRKSFNNAVVLEVATTVMEANNKSLYGTLTLRMISCNLHMPHSTVQSIVNRILKFFPYKIPAFQQLEWHDTYSQNIPDAISREYGS